MLNLLQALHLAVTGNNWDKEDVIGIYAVNSGQELAADAIYKGNSKYTVSESGTGDFFQLVITMLLF